MKWPKAQPCPAQRPSTEAVAEIRTMSEQVQTLVAEARELLAKLKDGDGKETEGDA